MTNTCDKIHSNPSTEQRYHIITVCTTVQNCCNDRSPCQMKIYAKYVLTDRQWTDGQPQNIKPPALSAEYWTLRLAWCRERSAVTATELLQPLDLACRTLFRSSCAIQTSPTHCSAFRQQLKGHLFREA